MNRVALREPPVDRGDRRSWAVDAPGAVVLSAVFVLVTGHVAVSAGGRRVDDFGYLLVAAAGLVMGLWRRWPRVMFGAVVLALGCYVGRRYPNGPILAAGWLGLVGLSWSTDRRTGLAGAAVLCGGLVVAETAGGAGLSPLPLFFVGWSIAAVLVGDAIRNQRRRLLDLAERARDLERTREEETGRKVAEERLRIARDLHDSVAHGMATINVQAAAAVHVMDRQPEAAKDALMAIREASGQVLDELGSMLAVLRSPGDDVERAPAPGLDQLPVLIEAARKGAVRATLDVCGARRPVASAVGTAVYRVVQEALTNVVRHAGPCRARVRVELGADGCTTVTVSDDGPTPAVPSARTGVGLVGLRERVESAGGEFRAGPRTEGGFAVMARWTAEE